MRRHRHPARRASGRRGAFPAPADGVRLAAPAQTRIRALAALLCLASVVAPAAAQQQPADPFFGRGSAGSIEIRGAIPDAPKIQVVPDANTTILPRQQTAPAATTTGLAKLTLSAVLTDDGEVIDRGLVWRVFTPSAPGQPPQLVQTMTGATPTADLAPGTYLVNAAFGRAHLTKRVTVSADKPVTERFVLNAGGLRAKVQLADSKEPAAGPVRIDILSDERDQHGNRTRIVTAAKPDVILRLNAGIYHLESRYGDANAVVRSEVSVEAGKLSEVTIAHEAASVTFKLVAAPGGEALAGTQWIVLASNGEVIKESVGALPTHVLAPGTYTVAASANGQSYRRDFTVTAGQPLEVEVVMR